MYIIEQFNYLNLGNSQLGTTNQVIILVKTVNMFNA